MKNRPATVTCCLIFLLQLNISFGQAFSISFDHRVGPELLRLDSGNYTNSAGQPFNITKFRYYIGNISLENEKGKLYRVNNYFLIDEDNSTSKKIILPHVPADHYKFIRFIIGVDSIHNVSGAQSGALDPLNGMFWTWNTGYIFLKLEGRSPASALAGNIFEYHIGGYKRPNNCIRQIELPLTGSSRSLKIAVDVAKMLEGPAPLDFKELPSVTGPAGSVSIADRYARMFSIE